MLRAILASVLLAACSAATALSVIPASPPPAAPTPAHAQQRITSPEWVVCFDLKRQDPLTPLLNLRVVVHAESEGDAVMKAILFLQGHLAIGDVDKLEYREAQFKK